MDPSDQVLAKRPTACASSRCNRKPCRETILRAAAAPVGHRREDKEMTLGTVTLSQYLVLGAILFAMS